ncbi:MAG TPA: class I SAM-dependent methyltransferase [Candidatus Thalassarchaeaceae archaeon]|nr:class I SAM-dependent methyltransferase [Candidatus Thalassarchaeaceae archaeon]
MEEEELVAIIPSKRSVTNAKKKVKPEASRKGEPSFFMTEGMKRLSTPWSVASIRAGQIDPLSLPAGVILDVAAGSGIQLIAFSKILKRPALGIELDESVAKLCAANMQLNSEGEVQRSLDRVLVGDGRSADSAIETYWASLRDAGTRAHPPIAMLHIDPARPRDAQKHSLDEMEPDIKTVLKAWSSHLQAGPMGPAVLLDLSPRLDSVQKAMIDGILETTFPGASWTWEWLSRGGGRIDRLAVWVGSLSSKSSNRCIRVGRKNVIASIEGEGTGASVSTFGSVLEIPRGAYLTIVDPVLIESGLQNVWHDRAIGKGTGSSWVRTEGRRPMLIHTDEISIDDEVQGFVVATGRIVQHRLSAPELNTIDQVASSVAKKGISNITLRCSLNPETHPTLQRRITRELKGVEGTKGFMVDMDVQRPAGAQKLYVVCKE